MNDEMVAVTLNIKKSEALMLAELLKVAGHIKLVLWPDQRFGLSIEDCEFIKAHAIHKLSAEGK